EWRPPLLPAPVALWSLVVAGHLAASHAPLPSRLEEPARAGALAIGGASLLAGSWRERRPGFGRRASIREGLEALTGALAAALAGAALGAEADRAAWPLPVHPRETAIVVEGIVLDTASIDATPPAVLFHARRVRVGETERVVSARLTLRWHDDAVPPRWIVPGLWLRAEGRYRPPEDARNPGQSAPGRWLERLGIAGTVAVDPLSVGAPPDPPERGGSPGAILRDRIARLFASELSPPVGALARGMLLGDRSGISPAIQSAFRDGGTIHILSISGLHVCILAGFLALAGTIARLPLRASAVVELAGLWAYVTLVGAPACAIRSALLWTAVRSGRLLGTVVRPFTAWGLAGLLIHLAEPSTALDPGFQLSFLAVLGLGASGALSRPPGPSRSRAGPLAERVHAACRGTWSLFVQSAGACVGTAGLSSRLFGSIPVVGLLLNLAVIPICTLFMAETALLLAAAAAGLDPVREAAAGAAEASGLLLLAVNAWGARLLDPWITREVAPAWGLAVAALTLLIAWATIESVRGGRVARRTAALWALGALSISAFAPVLPDVASSPSTLPRSAVVVSLDIGQGDATWIGFEDGASLLCDAGPRDERRDMGARVIEPALREEGFAPPAAVLSHAHLDHFGGFEWLARRGWIRDVWENGSDPDGHWREGIAAGLRERGRAFRPVRRDTTALLGRNARMRLLPGPAHGAENDRSLAAHIEIEGRTILLSGDLEAAGEEALLPRLGRCDVLKAPHHGSRTSSAPEWIERIRPSILLVSCGERNRFGHPDAAVMGRYRRVGTEILRTDREGAIRLTITRAGAWISTRAHPAPRWLGWRDDSR
ncbi:MAG TPA: ComEC/Rec2 family competence protein, partial [Candidatus Eisenbacteria bacterium]|nr:ComEC/Rec2 family competence protein [Candidatus Eisenbacteria bacterium]